jgi:phosphoglycerate dehydrogenase-like enzyme
MRVLAYDVAMDVVKKYVNEVGAEAVSIDTIYHQSHFITVHVPLLPETKHMIGTAEFNRMRDGVYVINTARGGVIDEDALKAALNSGKVKAAALDVYEDEPNPDEELIYRSNVICTPHIGAGSKEARIGNSTVVAEKLINFFKK